MSAPDLAAAASLPVPAAASLPLAGPLVSASQGAAAPSRSPPAAAPAAPPGIFSAPACDAADKSDDAAALSTAAASAAGSSERWLVAYARRFAGTGLLRAPPLPPRASAVAIAFFGSLLGMLALTSWDFDGANPQAYMCASFGATAVLVFAAPALPMAQPRNVVGGQTLSAFVGVALRVLLVELPGAPHAAFAVAALAVAASIAAMMACGVLHPAGAGTAMIAVVNSNAKAQGWLFIVLPVFVGSLVITAVGAVYNNLFTSQPYPAFWLW